MKVQSPKNKAQIFLVLAALVLVLFPQSIHAQTPSIQPSGLLNSLTAFTSQVITLNNPVKLQNPSDSFKVTEKPVFELSVPQKTDEAVGQTKEKDFTTKQEKVEAYFVFENSQEQIPATIQKDSKGHFSVSLPIDSNDYEIKHGTYTLQVAAKESFIYTRDLSQDFTWGVLAINTNKSIYLPGETTKLAIGVLNESGNTVCNAKLKLSITDPNHKELELSTENNSITRNPDCGDNYTPDPDYQTSYQTTIVGRYYMHIEAETVNGRHSITDYFEVRDSVPFDIERVNFPTRIYPAAAYDVQLKIKANQNYQGEVSDTVLKSFKVTNISNSGQITNQPNFKVETPSTQVIEQDKKALADIPQKSDILYANTSNLDKSPIDIKWQVDWKAGETYSLTYTLNFPPVSPEFYLIGPFKINPSDSSDSSDFSELRNWQIASDATKCWRGGIDANWSTANTGVETNWVTTAGAVANIAAGDVATFDSSTATCTGGSFAPTNNDSTVDAGFAGTVQRVSILTYTGTVTQSRSLTLSVGGTSLGFVQSAAGSTWNQGANDISATATTSDFILNAGTFTGGAATLTLNDRFTISGGTTFTAPTTVTIGTADNLAPIITGSITLNNLTLADGCTVDDTYTIASGSTVTIDGTLTLQTQGCGNDSLNGPGNILLNGDLNDSNSGFDGNATIYIQGTGNQTITGADYAAGDEVMLPKININKSSGTLSVTNSIVFANDFTYVKGTTDFGSSTVVFSPGQNISSTVTGSISFFNLIFNNACINDDVTIATGTTLTANGTLSLLGASNVCLDSSVDGSIIAKGNITSTNTDYTGTLSITLGGSQNQNVNLSSLTGTMQSGTFIVAKTGGTATLTGNLLVDESGQDLYIQSGTLDLAGFNLTVGDRLDIGTTSNRYDSIPTLKLKNSETITTTSTNINTGSKITYYGTAGPYTTLKLSYTYDSLTFDSASATTYDMLTGAHNLTLTGDLTISANNTLTAPSTITLGGNFANSGTFTAGSGTVTINTVGKPTTVSGSTTFNNLSCTTAGKAIYYTAGTTQVVGGTFTMTGSSGSLVGMVSTSSGSAATINVTGTASVTFAGIKDITATTGFTATTSQDGGGNTNITFSGSNLSGTPQRIRGGTTIQGGTQIKTN